VQILLGISQLSLCKPLVNPLNAELNSICHLLALLGAHTILHVSRIRVKGKFLLPNKILKLLLILVLKATFSVNISLTLDTWIRCCHEYHIILEQPSMHYMVSGNIFKVNCVYSSMVLITPRLQNVISKLKTVHLHSSPFLEHTHSSSNNGHVFPLSKNLDISGKTWWSLVLPRINGP
jgi:hypothetical protein